MAATALERRGWTGAAVLAALVAAAATSTLVGSCWPAAVATESQRRRSSGRPDQTATSDIRLSRYLNQVRSVQTLDELAAVMDDRGYNFDSDEREFIPRASGPAQGKLPLGVRGALESINDRYLDRSDEIRGDAGLFPVRWPIWAY